MNEGHAMQSDSLHFISKDCCCPCLLILHWCPSMSRLLHPAGSLGILGDCPPGNLVLELQAAPYHSPPPPFTLVTIHVHWRLLHPAGCLGDQIPCSPLFCTLDLLHFMPFRAHIGMSLHQTTLTFFPQAKLPMILGQGVAVQLYWPSPSDECCGKEAPQGVVLAIPDPLPPIPQVFEALNKVFSDLA